MAASINASGEAVVAWDHDASSKRDNAPGGQGYVHLAAKSRHSAFPPSVAIDSAGNATAVWQSGTELAASRNAAEWGDVDESE